MNSATLSAPGTNVTVEVVIDKDKGYMQLWPIQCTSYAVHILLLGPDEQGAILNLNGISNLTEDMQAKMICIKL
jgi:hypothetical protein